MPAKRPARASGRQRAAETSTSNSSTTPKPNSSDSGHSGLHKIFTDGKYYDLIIRCHSRTWKVHRAIICAQSKYFDNLFKNLSDAEFKEAHERTTYLHGDDPDHIESLLLFLYTNEYSNAPATIRNGPRTAAELLVDASLYDLAKKYDVPDLRAAAAKAFTARLSLSPSEIRGMLDLYELIRKIYKMTADTDRTLHDPLQRFLASDPSRSLARRDIQQFASTNEDFAADVFKSYFEHNRLVGKYWCATCGEYMSNVDETKRCTLGHTLRDT